MTQYPSHAPPPVLPQSERVLDDADVAAHTSVLLRRGEAARASVASIPVLPATSAFLAVSVPSPEELRTAIGVAMGSLTTAMGTPVPHVCTPHCSHAAPRPVASVVAPPASIHVHSRGCNHAPAPQGDVYAAAERGDAPGVQTSLERGGSTEEADSVSAHYEEEGFLRPFTCPPPPSAPHM